MYINSLHIKNFKSIKDRQFDFDKINVLYGEPYSGKSSTIQALTYALTNFLEENISEYVSWKNNSKNFKLDLLFNHFNEEYRMSIKAGDDKTYKQLINNELEFENSEVTTKLSELFDPMLTLYGSVSLQHQTTSVLFDQPANRLQKLKTILGMDHIIKASESMQFNAKSNKDKVTMLKAEIITLESQKFNKLVEPDFVEDIGLLKRFETRSKEYADYIKIKREYDDKISFIERQKLLYEQNEKNYKTYEQRSLKLNDDIISKQKEINIFPINVPLTKQIVSLDDYKTLCEEKNNLLIIWRDLDKQLKLAKAGKCIECGQDYIVASQEDIKSEMDRVKKKGSDVANTINEFDSIKEENLKIEKDNAVYDALRDSLIKELKTLSEQIDNLIVVMPPDKINSDLPIPPEFDNFEYEELKKRVTIYEQQRSENIRVRNFNKQQEDLEKNNKLIISEKKQELEYNSYTHKILEESRSVLDKDFSAHLIENGMSAIESRMNEFFSKIHSDYCIYLKRDKKSIEFMFSPSNLGDIIAPIGMLSGFERQIVSMAFRVALTEMQGFGLMVMDEIDGSANDTKSLALYKNIIDLNIGQVFIITHWRDTVKFLENECNAIIFEF